MFVRTGWANCCRRVYDVAVIFSGSWRYLGSGSNPLLMSNADETGTELGVRNHNFSKDYAVKSRRCHLSMHSRFRKHTQRLVHPNTPEVASTPYHSLPFPILVSQLELSAVRTRDYPVVF